MKRSLVLKLWVAIVLLVLGVFLFSVAIQAQQVKSFFAVSNALTYQKKTVYCCGKERRAEALFSKKKPPVQRLEKVSNIGGGINMVNNNR